MREAQILHERGNYWVSLERAGYTVWRNGLTHATADSIYAATPDGWSIAVARCNYLASREA